MKIFVQTTANILAYQISQVRLVSAHKPTSRLAQHGCPLVTSVIHWFTHIVL